MFGVIDETLKPKKPQLFLAKPNRTTIGKLNKFIMGLKHDINLGQLNEIEFDMPFQVEDELEHKLIDNPYTDQILERFLIKLKLGHDVEWFIINEIKDKSDNRQDIKSIHAFSLGYEINDKIIRAYEVVSYSLGEVVNDLLKGTLWAVGVIDEVFRNKRRSFNVTEKTALDFLYEVAETFGAFIEFDTVNRRINFRDPAKIGQNRSKDYTIGYGKYLKTIGKTSNSDELVTRLHVFGENGISINRVNPTGTTYIEDFSYFMFPFERDENRNVLQHSRYMSDELCHAILDYENLVESKRGVFATLVEQMNQVQADLAIKQNELFVLNTELKIIQNLLDVQRSHGTFLYHNKQYSSDSEDINFGLRNTSKYAIMAKITNANLKLTVDNQVMTFPYTNNWYVVRKFTNKTHVNIKIQGTGSIELYLVEITDDEYNSSDNSVIINKYNESLKQEQVDAKRSEVDDLEWELTDIENEMGELKEQLSIENNFSPELIQERNQYIIERVWSDNRYFDDEELYVAAKEKFLEIKQPKTIIDLDIINFLEVLEERENWNKLYIGDEIKIKHDKLRINASAKVTKISFDYDNQNIKLSITNVKNLFNDTTKLLEEILKQSYSTSTSVDMSKYKWDETTRITNEVTKLINAAWDATTRRIVAGANETVSIDNRGITIYNPDFPDEIIRINSGVVALSKDGGQNWQTAITPSHVVAEAIMGRLIAGENLIIESANGKFRFDENGLRILTSSMIIENPDGTNKLDEIDQKADKNEVDNLINEISEEISEVNNKVDDLNDEINSTFKDGVIQEAEAKAIATYLNSLNSEKADIDNKYNTIYNDGYLVGNAKTNLYNAKVSYNNAHNSLVASINNAISDGKVTPLEKSDVDSKFINYRNALSTLSQRFEEAIRAIENAKIDAVEVGGRNLFTLSDWKGTISIDTLENFRGKFWAQRIYLQDWTSKKLLPNETYTIRFKAKLISKPSTPQNNTWISIGFRLYEVDKGSMVIGEVTKAQYDNMEVGDEIEVVNTFTTPSNVHEFAVLLYCPRHDPAEIAEVEFSEVKLEKGNKATDWTSAPEDVQEQIDAKPDTTYVDDRIDAVVVDYQSMIQTKSNEILTQVSETIVTTEGVLREYTDSKISQTAEDFDISFTDIKNTLGEYGEELNEVRSYFNFSDEGLNIGKSDSPLNITISNEQMSFKNNDTIIAYINGQQMYITKAEILDSLIVGVHKFERYNNMTIVRWAGE